MSMNLIFLGLIDSSRQKFVALVISQNVVILV